MAVEITDSNFQDLVLNSDKPLLVDFWATWCGPCRMLGPIIEELHGDYYGKALVGKVDVDNNQQIAMQFGIRNIPTVLIFKNGEVVDKFVGVAPKAAIAEKLNEKKKKIYIENECFPLWEAFFLRKYLQESIKVVILQPRKTNNVL